MTDIMRKVWDNAANPADLVEYAVDSATAIEIGDLLWLDVDDVKPASATGLWTGGLAGTQGNLAMKFAGVAASAHDANDTAVTTVRVYRQGTFRFPLTTAAALEVGDLIAGSRNGSTNVLHAQQVDRIANNQVNQGNAIGRVAKRSGTSTVSVAEFEILASTVPGGGFRAFLTS